MTWISKPCNKVVSKWYPYLVKTNSLTYCHEVKNNLFVYVKVFSFSRILSKFLFPAVGGKLVVEKYFLARWKILKTFTTSSCSSLRLYGLGCTWERIDVVRSDFIHSHVSWISELFGILKTVFQVFKRL